MKPCRLPVAIGVSAVLVLRHQLRSVQMWCNCMALWETASCLCHTCAIILPTLGLGQLRSR